MVRGARARARGERWASDGGGAGSAWGVRGAWGTGGVRGGAAAEIGGAAGGGAECEGEKKKAQSENPQKMAGCLGWCVDPCKR